MASLTRPRFMENYAAESRASSLGGVSGNSHDIAVAVSERASASSRAVMTDVHLTSTVTMHKCGALRHV